MKTVTITVDNRIMNIQLINDTVMLKEVVTTSYGIKGKVAGFDTTESAPVLKVGAEVIAELSDKKISVGDKKAIKKQAS